IGANNMQIFPGNLPSKKMWNEVENGGITSRVNPKFIAENPPVIARNGSALIIAIGVMGSRFPAILANRREQNKANGVGMSLYSSSSRRRREARRSSRHFVQGDLFTLP
ncbi:hypothetical protein EBX93_16110, partial [bacterium]|nr:hypothetical protein [bacterium]